MDIVKVLAPVIRRRNKSASPRRNAPRCCSGGCSTYSSRVGIGSPDFLRLAIEEARLPLILAASAAGAVGKVLCKKGWFYQVAGPAARATRRTDTVLAVPVQRLRETGCERL